MAAGSWDEFLAIVRRPDPVDGAFGYVAKLVDEVIGSKLTTATVFDIPGGRLRRVFTENPAAYAVGGFKDIPDNKWTQTLLVEQRIYTALTIEAIAEDFFDWQLIQSLGCESIANLPVVLGGEVIGALNLLNVAGHYTPERLTRAGEILPFATVAFLCAHRATQRAKSSPTATP
jgi:hypothetical protein